MKTFFQNCFQRIPVSLDTWLPVFNGFLEHIPLKGFYYIFKIAKEFYYSASPAHLKNAFIQVQESMVNEAFVYSPLWRETEEFPLQQKIVPQQIFYWFVLPIASQKLKEQQQAVSINIWCETQFQKLRHPKKDFKQRKIKHNLIIY